MKRQCSVPKWLSSIDENIKRILPSLQDQDGGFRDEENGKKGCFSTIEGLYPLLLHPIKERWKKNIIDGVKYILENAQHGKISPAPEYLDIIDDVSVDSMAYGLYVLILARHFFRDLMSKNDEMRNILQNILPNINTQIECCIRYIEANQNEDGGWPLVRDKINGLNSRTYSTALIMFSLSNCEDDDFKGCKKNCITLIREGVNFLLTNNRHKDGGWFFSQPREREEKSLSESKTKVSLNLTATVVFSLGHLIRLYSEFREDKAIHDALHKGAEYIYNKTFSINNGIIVLSPLQEDYEVVDYPAYDKNRKGKIIKQHKFYFPYEMILPALILTPGYSIKSEELVTLKNHINSKFEDLGKKRIEGWRLYEFSDKVFALIYYNYLETLLEQCLDWFVQRAEIIRCVIDGSASCPAVINASETGQTIFQKIKIWWMKLYGWSKALLIQCIEILLTLPLLLYLDLNQISCGLPSATIWTIYAIIQTIILAGLQGYFYQKDKSMGDANEQKK